MSEEKEVVTLELAAFETGLGKLREGLADIQKSLSTLSTSMKGVTEAAAMQSSAMDQVAKSNKMAAASSEAVVAGQKAEAKGFAATTQAAKESNQIWKRVAQQRAELLKPTKDILPLNELRGFKKTLADIIPTQANTSIKAAIANIRQYNKAVEGIPRATKGGMENLVSGIASPASIKAMSTGFGFAFDNMLTSVDKFKLKMSNIGEVTKQWSRHLQSLGKQMQWTGRQMMIGITLPIALGAAKAISSFTQVNEGFTKLARVFAGSITPKMMIQLKKEAEEVSNKYHVMLSDVTQVFSDIAAWGVPSDKIKNFADQVLRLTKLGDMNTSQAEDFFRVVNSIFSQQNHIENGKFVAGIQDIGKQLAHTGDLMNLFVNVADKTQIMLQDLAQGFPEVAASANLFGFSAADTAAALAAMYQSGIDASEGANGMKFILQRIVNPTDKAAKSMHDYAAAVGIAFDPKNIKGTGIQKLAQIGAIVSKLGPDAQQRLLGDLGGLRQANRFVILLNQINQGLPQMEEALKKMATGASFDEATRGMNDFAKAEVTATIKNKDLRALAEKKLNIVLGSPEEQFKALKVKFQTMMYKLGAEILPIVTKVGNILVGIFDKILKLPDPFKKFLIGGLVFLAALGPINFLIGQFANAISTVGIFIGKIIPSLPLFTGGVDQLGKKVYHVGTELRNAQGPLARFFSIFRKSADSSTAALDAIRVSTIEQTAATEANTVAVGELAAAWQAVALAAGEAKVAESLANDLPPINWRPPNLLPKWNGKNWIDPVTKKFMSKKLANEILDSVEKTKVPPVDLPPIKWKAPNIEKDLANGAAGAVATKGIISKIINLFKNVGKSAADAAPEVETVAEEVGSVGGEAAAAAPEVAGLAGELGGAETAGSGLLGVLGGGAGGIVAAIGAIIVAIIALIPLAAALTGHWDDFMRGAKAGFDSFKASLDAAWQAIQPGLNAIGDAFGHVMDALDQVGKSIGSAFNGLIDKSDNAGNASKKGANKAASGWQGAGQTIGGIAKGIGKVIEFAAKIFNYFLFVVAKVIEGVAGFIRSFVTFFRDSFRLVADVIGVIVSLLRGDLEGAFKWALVSIVDLMFWFVNQITVPFKWLGSLIDTIFGTNLEKQVNKVSKFLNGLRNDIVDLINPPKIFSFKFPELNAPKIKPSSAKQVGETAGDQIAGGMADALADDADQIFDGFLSALKSQLDKQIDLMKQAAIDSLAAKHAAELKVYDAKIAAIEAVIKKEQELADKEEYLAKRKEILDQYALDSENYKRNRALAIYEGRIDDARGLDLAFQKTTKDSTKSLTQLDAERAKALLDATRQAQIDAIQAQKDAAAEIFTTQEESFKKQLDLITQYTPRTIGEMQAMIDGINNMLTQYGAPTLSGGFADAFGTYQTAVDHAKQDLIQQSFWAGKDVAAAWLLGFGGLTWQNLFGKPDKKDQPVDPGTPLDTAGTADIGGDLPATKSEPKAVKPPKQFNVSDFIAPTTKKDMGDSGLEAATAFLETLVRTLVGFVFIGPIALMVGAIVLAFKSGLMEKVADAAVWLFNAGIAVIVGLVNGIASAAVALFNWFMELPGKISTFLATAGKGFVETGAGIVNAIIQGIASAGEHIFDFFINLPQKIFDFFSKGAILFAHIGSMIISGILDGLGSGIAALWGFIAKIPSGLFNVIKQGFQGFINLFIKGANKIIGAVNDLLSFHIHLPWPIDEDVDWSINIPKIPEVNFHKGGLVNGEGDIPATLQGGEFVITKEAVERIGLPALTKMNSKFNAPAVLGGLTASGHAAAALGDKGRSETHISVDTFIGQREWFNEMMATHKVKTVPKNQRRNGTLNRRVGSYQDNTVRYG